MKEDWQKAVRLVTLGNQKPVKLFVRITINQRKCQPPPELGERIVSPEPVINNRVAGEKHAHGLGADLLGVDHLSGKPTDTPIARIARHNGDVLLPKIQFKRCPVDVVIVTLHQRKHLIKVLRRNFVDWADVSRKSHRVWLWLLVILHAAEIEVSAGVR